jgi:hypothetical protein
MLIKSFTAPVGLCMGGCIVGLALMVKGYEIFFHTLFSIRIEFCEPKGIKYK